MLKIFFFLLFLIHVHGDESSPEVSITQGRLRGSRMTSRKGMEFFAFQRIPYVKAPLGHLRFKSPQPPDGWEGVLDATKRSPMCTQGHIIIPGEGISGQEDCLFINVFTPNIKEDALLDVMVFIHGGGWVGGEGSYDGPSYLLDKNVVVVTFNYRLGPLGFLSTGDSVCPGNNGLKDQVAALRWVQSNIAAFGGNPNSVTIFGESAGGASVHYHVLSPMSKGLFHRAIAQSGTAFCMWALGPHGSTIHRTKKLASLLNCPTKSSTALLDCLRKKTAAEIIAKDQDFMQWDIFPAIPFQPVEESGEDAFLPASPLELARNLTLMVPLMTGITSHEGAFLVSRLVLKDLLSDLEDNFEDVAPLSVLNSETSLDKKEICMRFRDFYFQGKNIKSSMSSLIDLYTDSWFLHGTQKAVDIHTEVSSAPVYLYNFAYRGSRSLSVVFGDPTGDYGVCHGDDLLFLFPAEKMIPGTAPTKEDEEMIEIITTIWANFARNGDPNPLPGEDITWTKVTTPSNSEYLHIGQDGLQMKQGLQKERFNFWESLAQETMTKKDEL